MNGNRENGGAQAPDLAATLPGGRRLRKLTLNVALALVALGLTGCFKVGTDTATLRNRLMKSTGADWDEQIEVGVGTFTLTLARAGLAFIELDPEARNVLSAARGAEVGVYRRKRGKGVFNPAAMLADADRSMAARGWDRAVTVIDKQELVLVYVPAAMRSPNDVKACVAVLNDRDLVVASVRGNLEPIMDLVAKHSEAGRKRMGMVRL